MQQGDHVSGCSYDITVELVDELSIIPQSSEGPSVIFDLPANMKYSFQVSITNAAGSFTTTPINFCNVIFTRRANFNFPVSFN